MATWPKSGHQQKRDSRDSKQLALPMQKNGPNRMKIVITVAKMALRCQAMPAPILKKNLIFLPVHFMLALVQILLFRPIEPISCLVVVTGPRINKKISTKFFWNFEKNLSLMHYSFSPPKKKIFVWAPKWVKMKKTFFYTPKTPQITPKLHTRVYNQS